MRKHLLPKNKDTLCYNFNLIATTLFIRVYLWIVD